MEQSIVIDAEAVEPEESNATQRAFEVLEGTWTNDEGLELQGWNSIVVPYKPTSEAAPDDPYVRLLVNNYNERLGIEAMEEPVVNRGVYSRGLHRDQTIRALTYEQAVEQAAADDWPQSGLAGGSGIPIHQEPGFLLHMTTNSHTADVARVATIPRGNSFVALGTVTETAGVPDIPVEVFMPVDIPPDLEQTYLAPHRHFREMPFLEKFDPSRPAELLNTANTSANLPDGYVIDRTYTIELTTDGAGGVVNIPFLEKQATVTTMRSTIWIQELRSAQSNPTVRHRLQYLQVVFLDFERPLGSGTVVRWPHISINTMMKQL